MNPIELKNAYDEVRVYSPVEIVYNIERINQLVVELLLYASESKTQRTKQKYRKLAVTISELLPQDESTLDTGSTFSIGRTIDEVYAEVPQVGDDTWNPSTVIDLTPRNSEVCFDAHTNLSEIYQVDTSIFSDDYQKVVAEKEDERQKIGDLFQIIKKQGIDLQSLYNAYESNLWYDYEEKWSDNTMKIEIAFLRNVHIDSSIDIHNFGKNIKIYDLYQKSDDPEVNSEDILMTCLDLPCVQTQELDMEKTVRVFESFFTRTAENFQPGTDILYITFENDESVIISMLSKNFDIETDLKYRIYYFTQVIQDLQDQGKNILDINYSWKKIAETEESSPESGEVEK